MRVLDLFCGLGGWSIPFVEDGDEVIGVDITNFKEYPGQLILQDVRTLEGNKFKDFDVIIGSPPCRDFSIQTQANKGYPGRKPPDPDEGLKLVYEFERIIREAHPRFWAMENVRRMEKFYMKQPIWHFYVSINGRRSLWGNIPVPALSPDFRFNRHMEFDYAKQGYKLASALRSKIPYPIARFITDCIKEQLRR